jgi:hypothetical protein
VPPSPSTQRVASTVVLLLTIHQSFDRNVIASASSGGAPLRSADFWAATESFLSMGVFE